MEAWRMAGPVDFRLLEGEHVAIVGDNASGKSMLVDIITGRHPLVGDGARYDFGDGRTTASAGIKLISFKDCYGEGDGTYYLQQRWNQHDIDEEMPTVGSLLDEASRLLGGGVPGLAARRERLCDLLGMGDLLDKRIIFLSSGELRKFQLARALLAAPRVLVVDNPFIGLDAPTRDQLKDLLAALARDGGTQVVLVTPRADEVPDFITHVVEVRDMEVGRKVTREEFLGKATPCDKAFLDEERRRAILGLPRYAGTYEGREVVRMNRVTVRYGERTIIRDLDWTVNNGEKWALSGGNGAGKSTLLSLVCADNPQAYACDIELFGRRRGSGESIWEIKRRIGYVSPEMNRAYRHDLESMMIVASGLADSVGLYRKPTEGDIGRCRFWMGMFGIGNLAGRPFLGLSNGEQRLVLLARAFVKDPDLLVLDEPFHGLDRRNRLMATGIIEAFCQRKGKTLIMVSHYKDELPACVDHGLTLARTA